MSKHVDPLCRNGLDGHASSIRLLSCMHDQCPPSQVKSFRFVLDSQEGPL